MSLTLNSVKVTDNGARDCELVSEVIVADLQEESRKCAIPVECVKLGKWYVVKHNCVT